MTLYGWGANNFAQLGLGYKSLEVVSPQKVHLTHCGVSGDDIVSIVGGGGHTLILDKNGLLYGSGANYNGQLGTAKQDSMQFGPVDQLEGYPIIEVSCAWNFSVAITDCSRQFMWGNDCYAQLGLSKNILETQIPLILEISPKITSGYRRVSCGLDHSVILTKEGELLVSGNGNKGQLGVGHGFNNNKTPGVSKIPHLKGVKDIASGRFHSLALTQDGSVFSWGDNTYGQLGVDNTITTNSFSPVEVLKDANIELVYAGWTHSAALTRTGEVYTWGCNTYGQLGDPRRQHLTYKPKKIPEMNDVAQLSVGSDHCAAVTKRGKLFVWGCNQGGSCGIGGINQVDAPTQIFKTRDVRTAFACGGSTFAIVN